MKRESIKIFKALGDPNRVRILKMLEAGELCVCEVREVLNLSASTVSKHLSILRDADLLVDSKAGKWVNYTLNGRTNNGVVRSLLGLVKSSFSDDEQVVLDRKKLRKVDRNSICHM